jgi:hypothetical protein
VTNSSSSRTTRSTPTRSNGSRLARRSTVCASSLALSKLRVLPLYTPPAFKFARVACDVLVDSHCFLPAFKLHVISSCGIVCMYQSARIMLYVWYQPQRAGGVGKAFSCRKGKWIPKHGLRVSRSAFANLVPFLFVFSQFVLLVLSFVLSPCVFLFILFRLVFTKWKIFTPKDWRERCTSQFRHFPWRMKVECHSENNKYNWFSDIRVMSGNSNH